MKKYPENCTVKLLMDDRLYCKMSSCKAKNIEAYVCQTKNGFNNEKALQLLFRCY